MLHREERKSKEAKYQQEWRQDNPEKAADNRRKWRENSPEKSAEGWADGDDKTAAVRQDTAFEKRKGDIL